MSQQPRRLHICLSSQLARLAPQSSQLCRSPSRSRVLHAGKRVTVLLKLRGRQQTDTFRNLSGALWWLLLSPRWDLTYIAQHNLTSLLLGYWPVAAELETMS